MAVELDYDQASDTLTDQPWPIGRFGASKRRWRGKIAELTQTPDVDLSGQIVADWARLAPLWRPYAGPDRRDRRATSRGHFRCAVRWTPGATPALAGVQQMVGQATVSWPRANVMGMTINRGAVNAVLKDGTLTIVPVGVASERRQGAAVAIDPPGGAAGR